MKCDRCGKDANFYYSSTVNGKHEERCLCADCAREEGFENAFAFSSPEMVSGVLRGVLSGLLAASRPQAGGIPAARRSAPALSEAESRIPEDAGEEIRGRRETEVLRQRLAEAVAAEDYELAALLRDQLKG